MTVVTLTLVDSGHNFVADMLVNADTAQNVYFALGTGTSATVHNQTTLVNEVFRKTITNWVRGASVGEVLINCFVSDSDAVGDDIEEVAVFFGSSASATSNSGKMLGRALWTHNPKTNQESIQLQLDAVL